MILLDYGHGGVATMMLTHNCLEIFERVGECGFGFLAIDNANPEIEIFFGRQQCHKFRFEDVKLGERFRFGVRPSYNRAGRFAVHRFQRETPTTCDEISYKAGLI
jgi:hypothetical protein